MLCEIHRNAFVKQGINKCIIDNMILVSFFTLPDFTIPISSYSILFIGSCLSSLQWFVPCTSVPHELTPLDFGSTWMQQPLHFWSSGTLSGTKRGLLWIQIITISSIPIVDKNECSLLTLLRKWFSLHMHNVGHIQIWNTTPGTSLKNNLRKRVNTNFVLASSSCKPF